MNFSKKKYKKTKIFLSILSLLTVFFVGCSSSKTEADSENATYLESVDKYNTFNAIKLVDKETGCKYLVISADKEG